MSLMKTDTVQATTIEQVLISGDLNRLTAEQRNIYYKSVCDSLGLNPLTRPFDYIVLNGKLTLYARKDCTDQLRSLRGISIRIVSRESVEGVMVVTAQATDKIGRIDESTGAVSIQNLRGEALANALMKAETKAKRRATLSICGLGFTDESEVDSIPNARVGEPRPTDHIVETARALPAPKAKPKPEPEPESDAEPMPNGHEGVEVIDVKSIEEVKNSNGSPVWKITSQGGAVFAVFDPAVVSDIADAQAQDRGVHIEWQKRGNRKVVFSAHAEVE